MASYSIPRSHHLHVVQCFTVLLSPLSPHDRATNLESTRQATPLSISKPHPFRLPFYAGFRDARSTAVLLNTPRLLRRPLPFHARVSVLIVFCCITYFRRVLCSTLIFWVVRPNFSSRVRLPLLIERSGKHIFSSLTPLFSSVGVCLFCVADVCFDSLQYLSLFDFTFYNHL